MIPQTAFLLHSQSQNSVSRPTYSSQCGQFQQPHHYQAVLHHRRTVRACVGDRTLEVGKYGAMKFVMEQAKCDGALTREKSTHFWTYICSYLLLQRLSHRQLGAAMARPPSHLVRSKSITHFSVFSVAASSRPLNADQQSFVHRWGPIPALTRWLPAIALPNGQRA
jgi:hypothetical protein